MKDRCAPWSSLARDRLGSRRGRRHAEIAHPAARGELLRARRYSGPHTTWLAAASRDCRLALWRVALRRDLGCKFRQDSSISKPNEVQTLAERVTPKQIDRSVGRSP